MEEESKLVDWLENKLISGQNWNPLLNQRSFIDINTFHVKKEKFKKFPRFPFLTSSEKKSRTEQFETKNEKRKEWMRRNGKLNKNRSSLENKFIGGQNWNPLEILRLDSWSEEDGEGRNRRSPGSRQLAQNSSRLLAWSNLLSAAGETRSQERALWLVHTCPPFSAEEGSFVASSSPCVEGKTIGGGGGINVFLWPGIQSAGGSHVPRRRDYVRL